MEGTRLGILTLLQHQTSTVDQLSTKLGLASPTIRLHLDILQRDRFVTFETVRRKQGRPEHAYSLTEEGHELMPKRYHLLLQRVLEGMDNSMGDDYKNGANPASMLLADIARLMINEYRSRLRERTDEEPVRLLSLILEAEEFAPEFEPIDGGVRVTLGNCPYRGVASKTNVVCSLDHHLISEVMGAAVSSTSHINLGNKLCSYEATTTPNHATQPEL